MRRTVTKLPSAEDQPRALRTFHRNVDEGSHAGSRVVIMVVIIIDLKVTYLHIQAWLTCTRNGVYVNVAFGR